MDEQTLGSPATLSSLKPCEPTDSSSNRSESSNNTETRPSTAEEPVESVEPVKHSEAAEVAEPVKSVGTVDPVEPVDPVVKSESSSQSRKGSLGELLARLTAPTTSSMNKAKGKSPTLKKVQSPEPNGKQWRNLTPKLIIRRGSDTKRTPSGTISISRPISSIDADTAFTMISRSPRSSPRSPNPLNSSTRPRIMSIVSTSSGQTEIASPREESTGSPVSTQSAKSPRIVSDPGIAQQRLYLDKNRRQLQQHATSPLIIRRDSHQSSLALTREPRIKPHSPSMSSEKSLTLASAVSTPQSRSSLYSTSPKTLGKALIESPDSMSCVGSPETESQDSNISGQQLETTADPPKSPKSPNSTKGKHSNLAELREYSRVKRELNRVKQQLDNERRLKEESDLMIKRLDKEFDVCCAQRDNFQQQLIGYKIANNALERKLANAHNELAGSGSRLAGLNNDMMRLKLELEEQSLEMDELRSFIAKVTSRKRNEGLRASSLPISTVSISASDL